MAIKFYKHGRGFELRTTVNKSSYSVVVRAGPELKNSSELQVQAL